MAVAFRKLEGWWVLSKEPVGQRKVLITGGAGLVGQNLVLTLRARGFDELIVLDKHAYNTALLAKRHPEIVTEVVDLAEPGLWARHFSGVDTVVMLQAQIGAKDLAPFTRNTVQSTRAVLDAMKLHSVPYLVHVSSSVVNSVADDHYTRTKREQENMVLASDVPKVVLRPTLMFGWFDRKHLGWLARFMRRIPVFPVPGNGRYMRQPLYVGDFCDVIARCIEEQLMGESFNITGVERVDYIDIIRQIRDTIGVRTLVTPLPYAIFYLLLKTWALFDSDPPFTADQLKALVAGDEFDGDDWPQKFGLEPTPFAEAIQKTFQDPTYSRVELEF